MIYGTSTIYGKNKDKSIRYHEVVPVVFFTHAEGDEMETLKNVVQNESGNGEDLTSPKEYRQPVEKASKTEPSELLDSALGYFGDKYTDKNPIIMLLGRAQEAENIVLKNAARPTDVDVDAQLLKAAKDLAKLPRFGGDLQKALAAVKLLNAV